MQNNKSGTVAVAVTARVSCLVKKFLKWTETVDIEDQAEWVVRGRGRERSVIAVANVVGLIGIR